LEAVGANVLAAVGANVLAAGVVNAVEAEVVNAVEVGVVNVVEVGVAKGRVAKVKAAAAACHITASMKQELKYKPLRQK